MDNLPAELLWEITKDLPKKDLIQLFSASSRL